VNADDSNGESCMQEHWDEDHAMDGALDEAQDQRPSAIGSIPEVHGHLLIHVKELTFEASL
jgi:hypothetical protein